MSPAIWSDARIVAVDDQPANLRLLEMILTRSGYEHVETTTDPVAFLERFESDRPDLVLLDLVMPELDGIEVLRRLRAATPAGEFLPVLMLTAQTDPDAMRRALGAGVNDFLTKPFDAAEVELRIANLLRTRRLSLEVNAHNELLEHAVERRTQDLRLYQEVLATVPDPVVIEDPQQGSVVFANATIVRGLSPRERADNPWTSGGLASLVPEVAAGRRDSALVEDVIRYGDGTERPVEILVHAITRGDTRLLVGIGRDITDRVEAARALERTLERERHAAEELLEVGNLKDAFLTAVSHEIRTPLSVVNGAAQTLLQRRSQLDEALTTELLQRLATQAQRLEVMLLDLLDLNQVVRGDVDLRLERLRLDEVIRSVVSGSELGDRQIRLDLPAVEMEADPSKLVQALDALVANVAKHTPPGTPVTVTIEDDDDVRIWVSDQGPGIPDNFKQRVFAPFEHGPTSADHSPGTGIGLTLARTLVQAHGGRLWLEDTPGGGATFVAEIPRIDRDSA